jgi:ABC-type nitrate/sulfonate/bicarbonate transport system ATPase subunit
LSASGQTGGYTAIVVTHDVAEAVTLADRVLMIEARQITLNHRSIFSARAARRQSSRRWKGGFCASYPGWIGMKLPYPLIFRPW